MGGKKPKYKTGDKIVTNYGELIEIIDYQNYSNVYVKFENGFIKKTKTDRLLTVTQKLNYTSDQIAYVNNREAHKRWKNLLDRAKYNSKDHNRLAYVDVSICDEWLNYSNFEKWYEENYYEVDDERMDIDKDILVKGNRVYSPETCIFAPQAINQLFEMKTIKSVSHHFTDKNLSPKGEYLPVGITWCNEKQKYRASLNIGNRKVKNLGRFNTIEEAFAVYKQAKEARIKEVAEQYKDKIPQKLYDAMINWKVEITD